MVLRKLEKHLNFQRDNIFLYKEGYILINSVYLFFLLMLECIKNCLDIKNYKVNAIELDYSKSKSHLCYVCVKLFYIYVNYGSKYLT
jgi:hypothetical protein